MRENPWHLRVPSTEQYQWFRNLIDLHQITTQWLQGVQPSTDPERLSRGIDPKISKKLWSLRSLSETSLEKYVEDSDLGEFLLQLDRAVWTVQAWTLNHVFEQTPPQEHPFLKSLLTQVSWKLGKECAEKRWKTLARTQPSQIQEVLLALQDSPLSDYPLEQRRFLIKRSTLTHLQLELLMCPHQSLYTEVKAVADHHCLYHAEWTRGFAYALNHRIQIEHEMSPGRCRQNWVFSVNSAVSPPGAE